MLRDVTSDPLLTRLVQAALEVRQRAYAPYSQFAVGAALLAGDGETYVGTNVENASYGMSICAERAAVVSAVAAGQTQFQALAIVTPGGQTPCGACRQVLAEFCDDLPILLIDAQDPVSIRHSTLRELLPDRFRSSHSP